MKIVVYTAIFGDYDDLITPVYGEILKQQADFICFTDNPNLKSDFFNIRLVKRPVPDPMKSNRYYKILSHVVLPEYEKVIYVDANVKIICKDFRGIVDTYLRHRSYCFFKHTDKDCLYEEAHWVLSKPGLDNPKIVKKQIEQYRLDGFPTHFGLIAGTFILRNNFDLQVHNINELWWEEVKTKSRRDQLSFDYIRWKTNLKIGYLPGSWKNNFIGIRYNHKKVPKSRMNLKQKLMRLLPNKVLTKYTYFRNKEYRRKVAMDQEICRIKSLPENTIFETSILGHTTIGNNGSTFKFLYKELFENEVYAFITDKKNPCIVDCGANIGLSIIYFKKRYPECKIVAFEPDPQVHNICLKNVKNHQLSDVEIFNKAVWNGNTTIDFYADGSTSGSIIDNGHPKQVRKVETVSLREYLKEEIDFLKIDIEGAEVTVLEDCADLLINVKNIFVEYHSFVNTKQNLSSLLRILEKAGFTYIINSPTMINKNPFVAETDYKGMNFLLNISAYRKDS